jgi:glutamyl-tRNA(Gln) amidotransferase subunit D
MKPKVIVLTTGGTIEHRSQNGAAVMDFDSRQLITAVGLTDIDVSFRSIFRKGSMDLVPNDWRLVAAAVAEAVAQHPQGVVILHGTDTLHYTAAALAFMLHDLSVPVVLTGSMIPGGDAYSDALPNLRDAVGVAARADFAEVCVVFSADAARTKGLIIRGCSAKKVHSHAIDAFVSINGPPIGTIAGAEIVRSGIKVRPRGGSQLSLAVDFDQKVAFIKIAPNLTPQMLARYLQGASGAVLEGTGVGHLRAALQVVVAEFGKPTVISTQAVYGGERLGAYDVDRNILAIPNMIPARGMTSEAALVKLMWALGQGGDVRLLMQTDIAGEFGDAV